MRKSLRKFAYVVYLYDILEWDRWGRNYKSPITIMGVLKGIGNRGLLPGRREVIDGSKDDNRY